MTDPLHEMLDLWHAKRAEGLTAAEVRQFMDELRELDLPVKHQELLDSGLTEQQATEFWHWALAGFPGLHDDEEHPHLTIDFSVEPT